MKFNQLFNLIHFASLILRLVQITSSAFLIVITSGLHIQWTVFADTDVSIWIRVLELTRKFGNTIL